MSKLKLALKDTRRNEFRDKDTYEQWKIAELKEYGKLLTENVPKKAVIIEVIKVLIIIAWYLLDRQPDFWQKMTIPRIHSSLFQSEDLNIGHVILVSRLNQNGIIQIPCTPNPY
jgi:hypothetical protein